MPFSKDVASLLEILAKLPQRKIAQGVSALLLVYVAYLTAQLTWLIIPQDNSSYNSAGISYQPRGEESQFKVNIETLNALNLFGDHSAEPVEVIEEDIQDAPETSLRLTLTGVVASDDKNLAAAIIEKSGSQETYGVGDMITGTRALLEKVMPDRVLIKVSGRLETLMLDGFEYGKSDANSNAKQRQLQASSRKKSQSKKNKLLDQRKNAKLSEEAKALRKDLSADPGKITDYLKVVPKRKSGSVIGYRLMPGKKREFFTSSGLKSGDVAVQLNGYDLVDPLQAAQALQVLRTEQEISLLVDRNGDMTEIIFSISN